MHSSLSIQEISDVLMVKQGQKELTDGPELQKKSMKLKYSPVVKKNEYMGVWQILQATNCIDRAICIVYPEMFSDDFRRHLNRTFFPFSITAREREPIYIMWTCSVQGGRPNHFVPLLKH